MLLVLQPQCYCAASPLFGWQYRCLNFSLTLRLHVTQQWNTWYQDLCCNQIIFPCFARDDLWIAFGNRRKLKTMWIRRHECMYVYADLRSRSATARLLRLWVRIPPGAWKFVYCVCCVCCQVEVSATSWSLIQRSPTDCGHRCLWSINLVNEEALAHWGLSRQKQTNKQTDMCVCVV